jgi:hypothetical protein
MIERLSRPDNFSQNKSGISIPENWISMRLWRDNRRRLFPGNVFVIPIVILGFFFLQHSKCGNHMSKDFCNAIVDNDRQQMKDTVDGFLRKLDMSESQQQQFERIKLWLETHDCVHHVDISREMLDTDPPVKEFVIRLKTGGSNTIGIVASREQLLFNLK